MANALDAPEVRKLKDVAHRPSRLPTGLPDLQPGDSIWIAASTLETLHEISILVSVRRCFDCYIAPEDHAEIRDRVRSFKLLEQTRDWHEDLWSAIDSDGTFVRKAHPRSESAELQAENAEVLLSSCILAEHERLPLLADDRCLQNVAHFASPVERPTGFGTDVLLGSLFKFGQIGISEYAQCFSQLMRWRYRFLVPPPAVLMEFARDACAGLPGKRLVETAWYAHDCMADPGLLGGFERTNPPVSMAQRLYQTWCSTISEFLLGALVDPAFGDDALRVLTEWSLTEMLPSLPHSMPENFRTILANLTPRIVIGRAAIAAATAEDRDKLNLLLRHVAEVLGVDDAEYRAIISGAIDEA